MPSASRQTQGNQAKRGFQVGPFRLVCGRKNLARKELDNRADGAAPVTIAYSLPRYTI